jgi:methylated-DNA-[protein]-cysteine S-methyltransferase
MFEKSSIKTPVGPIAIACRGEKVCRLSLGNPPLDRDFASGNNLTCDRVKDQLKEYFSGNRKSFEIPLDWEQLRGFQRKVLEIVSGIPYGSVFTYGQVAAKAGSPKASRAVGAALAHNPLPILIPCHRVVSSSGYLTGYLGQKGIETKRWLLKLEGLKVVGEKLG